MVDRFRPEDYMIQVNNCIRTRSHFGVVKELKIIGNQLWIKTYLYPCFPELFWKQPCKLQWIILDVCRQIDFREAVRLLKDRKANRYSERNFV